MQIYKCMRAYACMHTCVCMHAWVFGHLAACTCVHTYVCVCMRACKYILQYPPPLLRLSDMLKMVRFFVVLHDYSTYMGVEGVEFG